MARAALGRRPAALIGLLRSTRYEVIPTKSIEESILAVVPRDIGVTVTASPTKGIEATVELAERLAGHGYHVVPHLSARLLRDRAHLADLAQRLRAAGVDDVFMPAGDADPPAGEYHAALPALADLTALGSPFPKVGITGYPESHPAIDDDVTVQAMWDKRSHATYIVSNLCFDAATIANWVKRVRRRGVVLPILLGLAGPVDRTKLLSMATKVGVGQSTRFLTQHASWFARLAAPGYAPERLVARVAREVGAPEYGLAGLHVFTFNQVAETEHWRQELLASGG
jgi:methylenetetrahydrofolate reductase (NADPH)